jgi:restriction system protein
VREDAGRRWGGAPPPGATVRPAGRPYPASLSSCVPVLRKGWLSLAMGAKKSAVGSRFSQFLQPVLDALAAKGGSARPAEVKEWILHNLKLPAEYATALHKNGESKFGNDVDWARFYLVKAGFIDSSRRGVWSLSEVGLKTKIDLALADRIVRDVNREMNREQKEVAEAEATPDAPASGYVEQALSIIKQLPPAGFENLCQRLLRESGFEEVTVTGKTGDGGIDGQGILQLNPFVSFRVMFQCKRYKDAVGPAVVRDFRGAMAGRAEKGIILTTGYFTAQAESEASRDGATPVEIVDGEALVMLLAGLELGLRRIDSFEVEPGFFRQYSE